MVPEKIAEGKTKIIRETKIPEQVLIEIKGGITAGDGAISTEITCNCFSLLNAVGIPTHFIRREGDRTFLAWLVKPLHVELVARRIATGSYLQRYPKVEEGTIFPEPVLEMFYKDDLLHDPLMVWNKRHGCIELYKSHVPIEPKAYLFTNPCDLMTPWGNKLGVDDLRQLEKITRDVFLTLESEWKQLNVNLAHLKIECGWDPDGKFVVADAVDNDSWAIWPMKDKQVYSGLKETTAETLGAIKENYAWVVEATRQFVH